MSAREENIKYISGFYGGTLSTDDNFNIIGGGLIGGKASGLAFIKNSIIPKIDTAKYRSIHLTVPGLAVLGTDIFDAFISRNNLAAQAYTGKDENLIKWNFQKASLPAEIVGELRELINSISKPLAIRSSSMLEDSLKEPFAGVYETKMISNSSLHTDDRFNRLGEAIKFVYSSTFTNSSKSYFASIGKKIEEEKMAVIIQEVAGNRRGKRFYPVISGVARSYNYYPTGKSKPSDGIVNLSLGLGKTIVDGGLSWVYSPNYPRSPSPFGGPRDILRVTQKDFWAVNISNVYEYDPTNEIEFLVNLKVKDAEEDNVLDNIASTYIGASDRIDMGIAKPGPRIIDFAPMLKLNMAKFNDLLNDIIKVCTDELKDAVEIEFAVDFDDEENRLIFYMLQLRPMMVSHEKVELSDEDFSIDKNLVISTHSFGNGVINDISDIVYVKTENFHLSKTREIASQIDDVNKSLLEEDRHMLLIGIGRWGSSDPWLGIPAVWGQISSARAIVEMILPEMSIDLSQGSHFFHNLLAFKVPYYCIMHNEQENINWKKINSNKIISETEYIKHIRTAEPLKIIVDGLTGKGIIK
jgi:hypothetical protein